MNYKLIEELCEEKGLTVSKLASSIGQNASTLLRSIKVKSINVNTLEMIAKALDVPITVFFEGEPGLKVHSERIDNLEQQINDLSKTINTLKEQIEDKRQIIDLIRKTKSIMPYHIWLSQQKC